MPPGLHHRLNGLRSRLDALKEGRVRDAGLIDAALARLRPLEEVPKLPNIEALHRELDRVGVHTSADARLLRALADRTERACDLARGLLERAEDVVSELEEAVRVTERAHLTGRIPPGTLTALERAWPCVLRVVKVADIFEGASRSEEGPLAAPSFEVFARKSAPTPVAPPQSARVAVAQFWAERARQNVEDVLQRRRDLDAAHELLLRIGSDFDRDEVRRLRIEVTDARERVRAVPPVRSMSELLRHVRRTATRDPREAWRALQGLYDRAAEANDVELARVAHEALRPFVREVALAAALGTSERSGLHADKAAQARTRPADSGAPVPQRNRTPEEATEDGRLLELALQLGDAALERFELAAGCARYFDVEDALSETVVSVEAQAARRKRARRVPYPTQRLEFDVATGLHEVRDFVISDPRLVLYDLASNRQMVRAYTEDEPPPQPRKVKRTAVRVYVCDASGSMHGARARFRDAVLLAELNNLRVKARRGEPFDPLYFCFFNDTATELTRVDSAEQAAREIQRLLEQSPAQGQTDITLALLQAFESIRAAQGSDPYLARATVVLVTDGEDRVDLQRIRDARKPVNALEIAMSFIALGEENRDLRSLMREQREQGARAFYVHLSDREILLARTEFDSRRRTLLPPDLEVTPVALEQLAPHLEALELIATGRAAERTVISVGSFDALFPAAVEQRSDEVDPTTAETLHRVTDILEAISEAASLAPIGERPRESMVLLEHLLQLYGFSVPRYLELLARGGERTRSALERIRLLCGPLG